MKSKKGFTLIELVIVVAILAVLTGIIVPTVSYDISNAKTVTCRANRQSLQTEIIAAYTSGQYSSLTAAFNALYHSSAHLCPAGGVYSWSSSEAGGEIVCSIHDGSSLENTASPSPAAKSVTPINNVDKILVNGTAANAVTGGYSVNLKHTASGDIPLDVEIVSKQSKASIRFTIRTRNSRNLGFYNITVNGIGNVTVHADHADGFTGGIIYCSGSITSEDGKTVQKVYLTVYIQ